MFRRLPIFLVLAILSISIVPNLTWACACGCGVFDVGTAAMFPNGAGGMAFLEYDYLDQSQNRSGAGQSLASDNSDTRIQTHMAKIGGQYLFNRAWGARIEAPYWFRHFETPDPNSGSPIATNHSSIGDIRLNAIYTGSSDDLSTGLTFGVKLPTGSSNYGRFDLDTQIGSGSYDLLLGAYHLVKLSSDGVWNGFGTINFDQPTVSKHAYIPGNEVDAGLGAYYSGWHFGTVGVSPVLATLFTFRGSDAGALGHPRDTGYRRVHIAPGIETDFGTFRFTAEVQLPIYQYYNGNQLAAPIAYKCALIMMF